MCGIAGLLFTSDKRPQGLDAVEISSRMIERLRHRGPEAVNVEGMDGGRCWLAHARLRVTDNHSRADQPFSSNSKRWKLVFNGEIYNYQDLDRYLTPRGFKPKTNSDSERLAEMIDQVGIECLHSIEGMFAFAAYDHAAKSLLLARDRFGQKPVYYVKGNGFIGFASELSALLELSQWIPMRISISGMSQYFSLRYIPAPHTAVEPIRKLEPGQYVIFNNHGDMILDRFFAPSKQGTICSNDLNRNGLDNLYKDPGGMIHDLLTHSISQTVPKEAAIIISGGIDSTLVAAYTAALDRRMGWNGADRNGYTVQLEHQPSHETQFAQMLSKRWGWRHELITLTDRQLINAYLRVTHRLDEPLGDRSLLPCWSLSQAIHLHHRVAIGGDGGDELFLGYERYLQLAPHLAKIGNQENWAQLYWQHGLPVGDSAAINKANQGLQIEPMRIILENTRVLQAEYEHSPIEFLQMLDLISYLPGSVLAKSDRSSMDWGLETRSPLLDTSVALAALALKPHHHIQGKSLKIVLRNLLTAQVGRLPHGTKQGFGAAIRPGSELERYLTDNIHRRMNRLMKANDGSETVKWLLGFRKFTRKWSQNSLFSLSIWLDWMTRVMGEFPHIEVQ